MVFSKTVAATHLATALYYTAAEYHGYALALPFEELPIRDRHRLVDLAAELLEAQHSAVPDWVAGVITPTTPYGLTRSER